MTQNIPENTSKNTHKVVYELLKNSGSTGKVLDIPSGAGAFTARLLSNNIEVYSGDIQNIMEISNDNFHLADMNKDLPFEGNFFDNVVCIDGIEHLERPFDFIRSCHHVIKTGGHLIISTPNINALRSRWRWFWTGHHNKNKAPLNEHEPSFLHHINMMSYQRLRYLLHSSGFKITEVKTNRVKFISYLYGIFTPLSWLFTSWVYRKEESDKAQKESNKEIMRTIFKRPLLFGETMIVKAVKI